MTIELDNLRLKKYQRNVELESLLAFFKDCLSPLEKRYLDSVHLSCEPMMFLMGSARSGSTLIYQYLASSDFFSYPTNFMSRFYYAPYLGARLQQMLIDADFNREIFQGTTPSFSSDLGKTKGPKAPHEFWYFWRQFFHFEDEQKLTTEQLSSVNSGLFLKELKAFQSVENLPLIAKGMICNWHIPFLASLSESIYFIFVERDIVSNAHSLLNARQKFFGTYEHWYSFKPPGYQSILSQPPIYQVLWQVLATNQAVRQGLSQLAPERFLHVKYEEFCHNPHELLQQIAARLNKPLTVHEDLPKRFTASIHSPSQDWLTILEDIRSTHPELAYESMPINL